MADISLVKPAATETVVVPSSEKGRIQLNFSPDQAVLDRPEGSDSLFFRFEDGGAIELQGFYKQYNKDEMPEFEVDGQLIAGADFFEAFGPELAPAAGPSSPGSTPASTLGGHYNEWGSSDLIGGIDYLKGLDIGFSSSIKETEDLVSGGNPGRIDDGEPSNQEKTNGEQNSSSKEAVNHDVTIDVNEKETQGNSSVTVHEDGIRSIGGAHGTDEGFLHINAPDGVKNISIAGVTVVENGNVCLVGGEPVVVGQTDADGNVISLGTLTVKSFDPATGVLCYEYTLEHAIAHDGRAKSLPQGRTQVGDILDVVVTDMNGDISTGSILINVVDGRPRLEPEYTELNYEYTSTSNPLPEMHFMGKEKSMLVPKDDLKAWADSGIEVKSGTVDYTNGTDGIPIFQEDNNNKVKYIQSTYQGYKKEGLSVDGGRGEEIAYLPASGLSQAVAFDLDTTAYGLDVQLGNLRTLHSCPPEPNGNVVDKHDEKAQLLFYKKVVNDDETITYELVDSLLVTSTTQEYEEPSIIHLTSYLNNISKIEGAVRGVTVNEWYARDDSTNYKGYYNGFDRVVFAAVSYDEESGSTTSATDTSENSDFLIQNIMFSTKLSSKAVVTASGKVSAHPSADGFIETTDTVLFDSDHFWAIVDGETVEVNVIVTQPSGTSAVATYGDKTLFYATLTNGKFDIALQKEFMVWDPVDEQPSNTYNLKFISAPDRDSDADNPDVGKTSVAIKTTSFNVSIINGDHVVEESGEVAIVHVTLNVATLVTDSHLYLHAEGIGDNQGSVDYDFVWKDDEFRFVPAQGDGTQQDAPQTNWDSEQGIFELQLNVNSANSLKVAGKLETASGSSLSAVDYITQQNGDDNDNYLYGTSGADFIDGHAGDDYIDGGFGNDHLIGGDGKDRLYGGADNDILEGVKNKDYLDGGSGNDQLYGGEGDDILFGRDGHDYLDGGEDADKLYGGDGNDILVYDDNDTIDGGSGTDILIGNGSIEAFKSSIASTTESGKITGVEAALEILNDNITLRNLADIPEELKGLTVTDSGISVSEGQNGWSIGTRSDDDAFTTYYHSTVINGQSENDAILVVKAVLDSGGQ